MLASKGFKEFGIETVMAMFKEFSQLDKGVVDEKPVVVPIDPNTLDLKDIEIALELVNLIKLKRDGTVKGRSCANGSKQRYYLKEFESVSSPTVLLESLLITLLIVVYEG